MRTVQSSKNKGEWRSQLPIRNSDHIVRRDKIKMREMHYAQRPLLL
jgi:hypothetical protein